jgi:hypothetical protein
VRDEAAAYFHPLGEALEKDSIDGFDINKLVDNITKEFISAEITELGNIEENVMNVIKKNNQLKNIPDLAVDCYINMARINSLENKISNHPEKSSFITNTLKEELFSSKRKYQDNKISLFPKIVEIQKKTTSEQSNLNKKETDAIVDKIAKNNQIYIKHYIPNHSDEEKYSDALNKLITFGINEEDKSLIKNARKYYINSENEKGSLNKIASEIKSTFGGNKKTDNYTLGDAEMINYSRVNNNSLELNTIKTSAGAAGDLYTDICIQKAAASKYLEEIKKSESFNKNEALTIFEKLTGHIDHLQDKRREPDYAKKKKGEIINSLNIIKKILVEEPNIASITEHSVDFLLIKKDENGLFHEKQGDNGTCALHRNNAIIANLTNNTQLLQTPYRIEAFARAELLNNIKDVADYIKKIEADANGTPNITLTELSASLKKIYSKKFRSSFTGDGFVMNYENTGGGGMKIKINNLNVKDASIMQNHGFNEDNITTFPNGSEYTFEANKKTDGVIKRVNNLDDEMRKYDAISVNIKTSGNQGQDASHAVCFIKDKNNDFYFSDSNTHTIKASISDFVGSLILNSSKPYLSGTIDGYKDKGYTQLKFTFGFISPNNQ